jgi:hypothetical protein
LELESQIEEEKNMIRIIRYPFAIVAWVVLCAAAALPARASFHVFGVNEVYSNPSGTVQFIELHDRFGADFEGFFNGVTIVSGANTYTFPSNLPSQQTANTFVLLGTPGYAVSLFAGLGTVTCFIRRPIRR